MKPSCTRPLAAVFAFAGALHASAANAESIKADGYACYPNHALIGAWPYVDKILTAGGDSPMTLKQCFELCNKSPGCVAVEWSKGWANKYPTCTLYKTAKDLAKVGVDKDAFLWSCVKQSPKAYKGPPSNQQEIPPPIPHNFYEDQRRPAPLPDPGTGKRR